MVRLELRTRHPAEDQPHLDRFLAHLEAAVRQSLAWNPDCSHATISGSAPDGRTFTAYAKREGPGDVTSWVREDEGAV